MQETHVSKVLGAGIAAIVAMVALWGALFAVQPAYADELTAGDTALTTQSTDPHVAIKLSAGWVKIDKTITATLSKDAVEGQTGTWSFKSSDTSIATVSGSGTSYKIKGVADGKVTVTATFTTPSTTFSHTEVVTVKGVKKASVVVAGDFKYKRNGVDSVTLTGTAKKDSGKAKLVVPKTVSICDKSGYKASYKVTAIGNGAIMNQSKTKTITVGNNVAKIGNHAFCHNPKLSSLVLGTGVTKIGVRIVHIGNKSLKTLTVKSTKLKPANVKNCLAKNKFLKTVKVPASKKAYYKNKVFTKSVCGKKVTVK